jgi:hypothetical protein
MTASDRARVWREQKRARGACYDCDRPADAGVRCTRCERARSSVCRVSMQRLRMTRAFLVTMVTLSEGKCVTCGRPKEAYHPLRCRACRRQR